MSNYLPVRDCWPACVTGDTFPTRKYTGFIINGTPPSTELVDVFIQLRLDPDADPVAKEFSPGAGITITDPVAWSFEIDSFVTDVPAGLYYYDIKTTAASGEIRTYLRGAWLVEGNVSRRES